MQTIRITRSAPARAAPSPRASACSGENKSRHDGGSAEGATLGWSFLYLVPKGVVLNETVSQVLVQQLTPLSVAYVSWRHLAFQITPHAVKRDEGPFLAGESPEHLGSHLQDVFSLGIFLQQQFRALEVKPHLVEHT